MAHLLCKTILQFASVTFIARTLGNEIPCGFADYLCIEKLPIARFIDTIVADLFSSTLVATCRDHISPWQSVHKLRQFTDTEITFVLASGGHNAGIISEPGHLNREYQISTRKVHGPWIECTQWAASVKHMKGSWWPAMHHWLAKHSGRKLAAQLIPEERVLCIAPGEYVLQRYSD